MYHDEDKVYHYETKKNLDVQRWIKNQLADDQIYYPIKVENVKIPSRFEASTLVHFLRLLNYKDFNLEAHAEFGDFMRVTFTITSHF